MSFHVAPYFQLKKLVFLFNPSIKKESLLSCYTLNGDIESGALQKMLVLRLGLNMTSAMAVSQLVPSLKIFVRIPLFSTFSFP